jgi:hypothetical protein
MPRAQSLRTGSFRASSRVALAKTWTCGGAFRGLFSVVSLAAFLVALTLAAAPGLHTHLHADAGAAQHECAVTALSSGKIQLGSAGAAVPAPLLGDFTSARDVVHPVWVPAVFLGAGVFEHAPPSLS